MNRELIYKGIVYKVLMPRDKFWHTYHVTKHVINHFEDEGFINFMSSGFQHIKKSREHQIDNLLCSIDFKKNNKIFCAECKNLEDCHEFISSINDEYVNMIFESLENDQIDPCNATYYDRKISMDCILIINDEGVSIIVGKKDDACLVRTAFGFSLHDASEMSLKFRKLLDDSVWRKDQSIISWKDKFDQSRFEDVDMHNSENWKL